MCSGAFLRIGEQFLSEREILGFRSLRGARAGERAAGDRAPFDPAEDFRLEPISEQGRALQVEHERRGIDDPQGAVDIERIGR